MTTTLVDPHGRKSWPAGITGLSQFLFVALNAAGQLVLPGANGLAIGILDDAPPLNAPGSTLQPNGEYAGGFVVGHPYGVVFRGLMKVYAAATLAPMVPVAANAQGQAVAAAGVGTWILGVTTVACNSGDLVQINISTPSLHN